MPDSTRGADAITALVAQKTLSRLAEFETPGIICSITTPEELSHASNSLAFVQMTVKALDNARKKLKAPHVTRGREVDEMFRPWLDRGKHAEHTLKATIKDWQLKEFERQKIERDRVEKENAGREKKAQDEADERTRLATEKAKTEAHDAGFTEQEKGEYVGLVAQDEMVKTEEVAPIPEPVPEVSKKIRSEHGSVTLATRWDYEVTSPTKLAMAWMDGRMPAAVGQAIKIEVIRSLMLKAIRAGARDVPGMRIFETHDVRGGGA